jgi:hypothetical protein
LAGFEFLATFGDIPIRGSRGMARIFRERCGGCGHTAAGIKRAVAVAGGAYMRALSSMFSV